MSRFTFPSIEHSDKLVYVHDTEWWESGVKPGVSRCCQSAETYGDGMTQHSASWPIQPKLFADYMMSLSAFLMDNQDYIGKIDYDLKMRPMTADIEFASTVVYKPLKEGESAWTRKKQYFSRELRKVSSSESKRHDKRYEEVLDWMDGKPEAICRLLWSDWFSPLRYYAVRMAVRDWLNEIPGDSRGWMDLPYIGEEDMTGDEKRNQRTAWETLQSLLSAYDKLDYVKRCLESHKGNVERRKEREAQPAEVTE